MSGLTTELNLLNKPSEEKFFEHCTNCAILSRPLSCDHFCENSASLLFHSSARERLQIHQQTATTNLSIFFEDFILKTLFLRFGYVKILYGFLYHFEYKFKNLLLIAKVLDSVFLQQQVFWRIPNRLSNY